MDTHTPLTITILVDGIEKMTTPSVSVAVGALRHSFGCLAWKNEKDLALSMANAEGRGLWVELKRKGFKTIQITWTHTQTHTQPHTPKRHVARRGGHSMDGGKRKQGTCYEVPLAKC